MKTNDINPIPSPSVATTPQPIAIHPATLICESPMPLHSSAIAMASASTPATAIATAIQVNLDPLEIPQIISQSPRLCANPRRTEGFRVAVSPRQERANQAHDARVSQGGVGALGDAEQEVVDAHEDEHLGGAGDEQERKEAKRSRRCRRVPDAGAETEEAAHQRGRDGGDDVPKTDPGLQPSLDAAPVAASQPM